MLAMAQKPARELRETGRNVLNHAWRSTIVDINDIINVRLIMAQAITVRQIDPHLHDALKLRAAKAGRSVEAEVRAILADACLPQRAGSWTKGIRDRARTRTAGRDQTDSADLIREARDAR